MKLAKQVIQEVLNSSNIYMTQKAVAVKREMDGYTIIGLRSVRNAKVVIPYKDGKYRPIEVITNQSLAGADVNVFGPIAEIDYLLKGHLTQNLTDANARKWTARGYDMATIGPKYQIKLKVKKDYKWMDKETFYLWLIKQGVLDVLVKTYFPEMANIEVKQQVLKHKNLELIGFDEEKHAKLIDIFDEGEKKLKKAGFDDIMYGKLFLVPKDKGGGRRVTFADYVERDDSIRVFDSATTHKQSHPVRTFLHELGHRYYYKRAASKKSDIVAKYREVVRALRHKEIELELSMRNSDPILKDGTKVAHPKHGTVEYAGLGGGQSVFGSRRTLTYNFIILDSEGKRTSRYFAFKSLLSAKKWYDDLIGGETGESTSGDKWLPTEYSKQDAVEWFAEIFSFAVQDHDEELLNWIKGL